MPPVAVFNLSKIVVGRVFPGLFIFPILLPCVAFRFSRSCRAWRLVHAVFLATAIATWLVLRGVPRAFGITLVLLGLLLASLRVAVAFRSDCIWSGALVFPAHLGMRRIAASRPAQTWIHIPPFEPARSPG